MRRLLMIVVVLLMTHPALAKSGKVRPLKMDDVEVSPSPLPEGEPETLPDDSGPVAPPGAPSARRRTASDASGDGDLAPRRSRRKAKAARSADTTEEPSEEGEVPAGRTQKAIGNGPGREVRIFSDATNNLQSEQVEYLGHVRVEREGNVLATDKIRYNKTTGELNAIGNVVLSDPHYVLTAGRFSFYGPQDIGVAFESPRITESQKNADGDIIERTDITAFQITLHTADQRVEGLERVRVYRMVRKNGKLELEFKITADGMDSNMVTHQSVFKGDVKVDSPSYSIEAKRLIYDVTSGRFTAIGDAKVTGFGPKGEPTSHVEGNKLVHLIQEHRTLILGGVTAVITPGKPFGTRDIDASALKDQSADAEVLSLPAAIQTLNPTPEKRR
jgi:lipopolysaccharide export system protein LptA